MEAKNESQATFNIEPPTTQQVVEDWMNPVVDDGLTSDQPPYLREQKPGDDTKTRTFGGNFL